MCQHLRTKRWCCGGEKGPHHRDREESAIRKGAQVDLQVIQDIVVRADNTFLCSHRTQPSENQPLKAQRALAAGNIPEFGSNPDRMPSAI